MAIRVAICDDQALVRDGLQVQLGLCGGHRGRRGGVRRRAGRDCPGVRPDVLLMDVRMPRLDGVAATRLIVADPACTGVRVLVLTTFDVDETVFAALAAGASGFLLKDATPEEIVPRCVSWPPASPPRAVGHLAAGARVRPSTHRGTPTGRCSPR